jgi:PAS domain S-box-containing protein
MPINFKAFLPQERRSPKRWRLYAILAACSVLPFLLFLYAADRFLHRATTNNVLQQTGPAAELAANVITERMADARAALEGLAEDPALLHAWEGNDVIRLTAMLQMAHDLRRDVAYFALYDSTGHLRARFPAGVEANASPAIPARFSDAMQNGKAYVSGVMPLAGTGKGVTVAVSLHTQRGGGVLSAVYTLDTVKSWTKGITPGAMRWISIVDQNGTLVTGANLGEAAPSHDVNSRPEVKQVLAGKDGTEFIHLPNGQALVTRRPLSPLGWGVLVEIPVTEINAAIWKFERPIGFIALVFMALALVIGIVVASLYRRLKASEQHIRQIITAATDAFISINREGIITEWNPKAEELFGWSRAEALGRPVHTTIIPPQYRESYVRGLKNLVASGEGAVLDKRIELTALHCNGREFPVEVSITCVQTGGKTAFNAFLHDITKRKQHEQQISLLNAELRARVSELEARNKALESFSYSVSHDVRAPLRNIAGFTEVLQQELAHQLAPAALDYLNRIQGNVVRMQRLVDDLLRFARLGEQGLKLQPTDLKGIVHEVIRSLEPEVTGRDVIFEISSLPSIECDRGLITQVFWNLLANAVKFTSGRKHAVISVGAASEGDEEDIFFVRDNGVGFDMGQAARLFVAFQRLHRYEEFEGTGVGLATVQRIISKHQGRIWAYAEPERGATFYFSLRRKQSEARVAEMEPTA